MQSRPLRDFERGAHLHVLDWAHATARQRLEAAGEVQVRAAAKAMVQTPAGQPPELPSLEAAVHDELAKLYALGHATVRSELDHQHTGQGLPVGLSAAPDVRTLALGDPAPASLHARAALIAHDVAHQIHQAVHRGRLQGITALGTLRRHGREAGAAALRSAASHHAGGAINAGRHAAVGPGASIHTADGPVAVIGARYTSILDKSTCGPCAEADTGQLLALDDPALVTPPNPACLGGDRCRCILVYALESEGKPVPSTPVPVAVGVG